ncbi:MAG: hypothetical protein KAV87_02185 [Desulfobacteraceae bacterium]|nr:hypothetical protein [Desulfobacteraceae bacterium]
MSGENQSVEYIKVVADIITTEMGLTPPGSPPSTATDDNRVFIYNQNFDLPTYDDMFIVLSESPGKVIANVNRYDGDGANTKEVQEIIMQREIGIDVMSRNDEARNRKEQVLMALMSNYSQQKQEENGMRIFGHSFSFIDVSENEGSSRINRYRASLFLHVKYSKEKAIDYYNQFPYNINTNR